MRQVLHGRHSDRRLRVVQTEEQRRVRVAQNLQKHKTLISLQLHSYPPPPRTGGTWYFPLLMDRERNWWNRRLCSALLMSVT